MTFKEKIKYLRDLSATIEKAAEDGVLFHYERKEIQKNLNHALDYYYCMLGKEVYVDH